MQVNRVQQSPNFGMALRLRPSSKKALANSSMELINKLDKIGSDLSNTKYFHLEIDGDLRPHISSFADHYYAPFNITDPKRFPGSKFLYIETIWDGMTDAYRSENRYHRHVNGAKWVHNLEMESEEAVQGAYAQFKALPTDIDRGAFLTKLLDDAACKKFEKFGRTTEGKDAVKVAAQRLFDKYGMKPISV